MRNYIHKIAKDNLKKNSQFYRYLFISIFFTFFIVMFITIIFSSLDEVAYNQRTYYHGKWDVIVTDADEKIEKMIEEETECSDIGKLYLSGEVIFNHQSMGYLGSYDETGKKLANLHLIDGRMAQDSQEIVIEKSISENMSIEIEKRVELNYTYNNEVKSQEFTVVGIVEDYTNQWSSRGLSFITSDMEYHDYDLLLKGKSAVLLWNCFRGKDMLDVDGYLCVTNMSIHPYIVYHPSPMERYLNESTLLKNITLVVVIAFIAVISTMMSSLNKRESHFVLLRSIGMTYKQLQRLIIYEGFLLSAIAFIFSIVISIIFSMIVMLVYSLIAHITFTWNIGYTTLFIELGISIIAVMIGIFIPTLTIYDMPLVRKNGEYIYHSKKKKFRRPTIKYFIKNELLRNKVMSCFVFVLIIFILLKGFSMIDMSYQYLNNKNDLETKQLTSDFIWINTKQIDLSPILNDKDIHVYKSKFYESILMSWEDMDKENSTIRGLRSSEIYGNIVCIDNDQQVKDFIIKYIDELELNNNEAVVVIPNCNYSANVVLNGENYKNYTVDIVRKEGGNYPEDKGLAIGKNIVIDGYQSLKIKNVIRFKEEPVRDYFDEYTVIVNKDTYMTLCYNSQTMDIDNYITVTVDNEKARNKVQSFFNSVIIEHKIWQSNGYYSNVYMDKINQLYTLKTNYLNDMVYNSILMIIGLLMIYMMRLLSSYKIKKDIGLYRSIGMTKKNVYMIHLVSYSIIYIIAIVCILIGYVVYYRSLVIDYLFLRLIILFALYFIYIAIMLVEIKNILKENILNLVQGGNL